MRPQELSIGNLVCYNGKVVKVQQITKHKIGYHTKPNETRMNYARLCEIKPIPITGELLLKCGFGKRIYTDKVFVYEKGVISVIYFIENSMCDIQAECDGATILCTHLHDLQNAYQLVTKEELILQL